MISVPYSLTGHDLERYREIVHAAPFQTH
jgi:hypothetical protein